MDTGKLTQRAQEALLDAQKEAVRRAHPEVDGEHLFWALMQQDDGLVPIVL